MHTDEKPLIDVELFGIPRARAGTARVAVCGETLGAALVALASQYPALAAACIEENRLRPGYLANLSGRRFITDPATPLVSGDTLLILSADAGG